jgi:hypothetical protein
LNDSQRRQRERRAVLSGVSSIPAAGGRDTYAKGLRVGGLRPLPPRLGGGHGGRLY